MSERAGPRLHGWLVIDKPVGIGSTQVVGAVKRALREGGYAKVKVGHGGTLDPLASGVLPVALGEATKLAGRMLDAEKIYDFTITFGVQTDSLDADGTVVATSAVRPNREQIREIMPRFVGEIEQVPPVYSALRVDGERAYDRARRGEVVAMKPRRVVIFDMQVPPGVDTDVLDEITLTARVSKGTYIRSLSRDIALALGTVGHVTMLRRTLAGPFALDAAILLDNLSNVARDRRLQAHLLPLEAGLDGIPALSLAPGEAQVIRHGGTLSGQSVDDGPFLATDGTMPVALVEVRSGIMSVVRGFTFQTSDTVEKTHDDYS